MNVSRRTVFKWLVAALPLLDIGCAGVGTSRARQIGGVFPLLCTPYSEDGSLDCETLSREAAFRGFKGRYRLSWKGADGKECFKFVEVR